MKASSFAVPRFNDLECLMLVEQPSTYVLDNNLAHNVRNLEWYLATNQFIMAGVIMIVANIFDFIDGKVAHITGKQSEFGAFWDSTLDRFSDLALFTGLIWLYAELGRNGYVLIATLALIFGIMTSTRGRAESADRDARWGSCRAERLCFHVGVHNRRRFAVGDLVLSIITVATPPYRSAQQQGLAGGGSRFFFWRGRARHIAYDIGDRDPGVRVAVPAGLIAIRAAPEGRLDLERVASGAQPKASSSCLPYEPCSSRCSRYRLVLVTSWCCRRGSPWRLFLPARPDGLRRSASHEFHHLGASTYRRDDLPSPAIFAEIPRPSCISLSPPVEMPRCSRHLLGELISAGLTAAHFSQSRSYRWCGSGRVIQRLITSRFCGLTAHVSPPWNRDLAMPALPCCLPEASPVPSASLGLGAR